jgi:hypothetical protein
MHPRFQMFVSLFMLADVLFLYAVLVLTDFPGVIYVGIIIVLPLSIWLGWRSLKLHKPSSSIQPASLVQPAPPVQHTPNVSPAPAVLTPSDTATPAVLLVGLTPVQARKALLGVGVFWVLALALLVAYFLIPGSNYLASGVLFGAILGPLAIYRLTREKKESALARTLANSISVNQDDIILPTEFRVSKVQIQTARYASGRSKLKTSIIPQSPAYATQRINWRSNLWGGVMDRNGIGWFHADGYVVSDGTFKGVILVPVQPSKLKGTYSVTADNEDGFASAEVTINGPRLSGRITQPQGEGKTCSLRIRGKAEIDNVYLDVRSPQKETFSFATQPTSPLILVGHSKFFNPPVLMKSLIGGARSRGTIFGGIGLGVFNAELVIGSPHTKPRVFESEPIPY